jgi:hypothetical protein
MVIGVVIAVLFLLLIKYKPNNIDVFSKTAHFFWGGISIVAFLTILLLLDFLQLLLFTDHVF